METLLNTLLWILIFYNIIGWVLRYYVRGKEREEIRAELDEKIRVVRLENLPEHNIILAYDAENNRFLGQGASEQELENIIKQRFPKNIFVLNKRMFTAMHEIQVNHETSTTS
jgi:hypothetical protein